MCRRIATLLFLVLATLAASTARAEKVFKRPALAVRAAHQDATRAHTTASKDGEHTVVWQTKASPAINVTPIDAKGLHGPLTFTSKHGTVIGMSRSGKSAIVEITTPSGGK